MKQEEKILQYMKVNGAITQREALSLGIYRLASRICDMRKAGINISSELIEVTCADGSKARVSKYWLPEVDND